MLFTLEQRQAIGRLDLRDIIDLTPSPKAGRDYYNCPACGSGTHANGTGALHYAQGKGWKCYSCKKDTAAILAEVWGKSLKEVKAELIKGGYIPAGEDRPEPTRQPQATPAQTTRTLEDITATQQQLGRAEAELIQAYRDPDQATPLAKEAWKYLTEARGLSAYMIQQATLGCMVYKGKKAITFPLDSNHSRYIVRFLEGDQRYDNQRGASPELWNAAALYEKAEAVFIVEGAIDGLSVIQALEDSNATAMALNSTANSGLLLERLTDMKAKGIKPPKLILALDNDEAGWQATDYLARELGEQGLAYKVAAWPETKVDPNSYLVENSADFSTWIKTQLDPHPSLVEYLACRFLEDQKEYTERIVKTGWEQIDTELGGLHTGLYVIGGRPGCGKTTFAWQLADTLAENGKAALFFSLEQSAYELACKSLAREMAQRNSRITNARIRKNLVTAPGDKADLNEAMKALHARARRLRVIESCRDIVDLCATIKEQHRKGNADCVLIDYLQIIPPDKEWRGDRLETLDRMTTMLRQTARALKIPIILLSALNRQSYNSDGMLESFKGSGGIEYSVDVAMLLEVDTKLELAQNKEQAAQTNARNAAAIDKGMKEQDRLVKLDIKKNRYGALTTLYLTYHTTADYFTERS